MSLVSLQEKLFPSTRNIKILDHGAGTGTGGKRLAELGLKNVEATDGSHEMLEIANKLGVYKNVLFRCARERTEDTHCAIRNRTMSLPRQAVSIHSICRDITSLAGRLAHSFLVSAQ
jgi:predicted RNA methylase